MSSSDVNLDLQREQRVGFDEAVFCASKTAAQIAAIVETATERGMRLLLTRLEPERFAQLPSEIAGSLDYDSISLTACLGEPGVPSGEGRVAVVSAGTSDARVVHEAARTLRYYGEASTVVQDVGVAGLWRLLDRIDEIRRHGVVIAVAGMEGALPSVIGGLVPGVVIAVPTSIGYGVGAGGVTALHSALASCAPGLLTVNIDNGYGAACAALRVLNAQAPVK